VAALAEAGRLGVAPPRAGERTLVYEVSEEGDALRVEEAYQRIEEVDVQHPPVRLSEDLRARLRRRPRTDARYLLTIYSPPIDVAGRSMWSALLLDASERRTVAQPGSGFEEAALGVFERLADGAGEGIPREVWTDSYPVFAALKDAWLELEVRFGSQEEIPELEAARASLDDFLTR